MSRSDAAALLKLAESIADGAPIDWEAVEAGASGEDRAVIGQLRVLSNLAGLHRSSPGEEAGSRSAVALLPRRDGTAPAVGSWAHLSLVERLGGGTFADVYRAWDRRLEREVALKLLRVDGDGDIASSRIANEGRLLARVRHQNVITVHGVDAQDDRVGLWMELVRGATLEQQLAANGPFSAREAAAIGIDLCRALAAIHGAGLIHRDVKAQNVMREDGGRIVLMDLGTGREADRALAGGMPELAGTPLYLAPEIFTGSPASARTDLYSLGVLLYHVVTGSFPVRAATFQQLAKAHANGTIVRLRDARADLPTAFVRVVDRAIAPEPAKRYQSAGELEADLVDAIAPRPEPEPSSTSRFRRLNSWPAIAVAAAAAILLIIAALRWPPAAFRAPAGIRSVAVLPLANLSGDPAQEYFADGMTDELIGVLSQLRDVNVISRTSAMQFKGTRQALPEIARALHADAVIEGSVVLVPGRDSGDADGRRVRVHARLVYAGTDTVAWDRTFEARIADVFALRADIVKAVTEGIHARLAVSPRARAESAQSFEAFDLYLKGRYYWNQRSEDGLKQSIQYFQAALQQSPDYALAYAGLADAYNLLGFYGYLPTDDAHNRAAAAAGRAVALDDSAAEAYASLGYLHEDRFEWNQAEDSYRRAIDLKPGYATARHWYGYHLAERGRFPEAIDEMAKAVDLDPLSAGVNSAYGSVLIFARRFDDAIAQLQHTIAMDPGFARARIELANALMHKGDLAGAQQAASQAAAVAGRDASVRGDIGYIDAVAGQRSDAEAIAGELADRYNQGDLSAAMPLAVVYAGLGAYDDAFAWIDRARQSYAADIGALMVDPRFDPMHSDPRFGKLLAAVGLAQ